MTWEWVAFTTIVCLTLVLLIGLYFSYRSIKAKAELAQHDQAVKPYGQASGVAWGRDN